MANNSILIGRTFALSNIKNRSNEKYSVNNRSLGWNGKGDRDIFATKWLLSVWRGAQN
jgi:hypothetical protein